MSATPLLVSNVNHYTTTMTNDRSLLITKTNHKLSSQKWSNRQSRYGINYDFEFYRCHTTSFTKHPRNCDKMWGSMSAARFEKNGKFYQLGSSLPLNQQ